MDKLKRKSAGTSAVSTSTVTSNGCAPKVISRINGLTKKGPGRPSLPSSERSSSTVSPHMTRLATKRAASSSECRAKRRENREQRKQQPRRITAEDVSCKGNKVHCQEESGNIKVKKERMEIQEDECYKPQEEILRTLSKDLVLSDTDDEVDPMITDSPSQTPAMQTNSQSQTSATLTISHNQTPALLIDPQIQSSAVLSYLQQNGMKSDPSKQHEIYLPSQLQNFEVSGNESHASCYHEQGQIQKETVHKSRCARCLRYNSTITIERRRQTLLALWMSEERRKSSLAPLIVQRRDKEEHVTPRACIVQSYCKDMLRNGYRMKMIKVERQVKEEVKAEPSNDSHIPHHLLTEEQQEKARSSSPDMTTSSDGDIIAVAMEAALNGVSLDEGHLGEPHDVATHDEDCLGENMDQVDSSMEIKSHNDTGNNECDVEPQDDSDVGRNNIVGQANSSLNIKCQDADNADIKSDAVGSCDPAIESHDVELCIEGELSGDNAAVQKIDARMDNESCDIDNARSLDVELHNVGLPNEAPLGGDNVVQQAEITVGIKSHDAVAHDPDIGSHDRDIGSLDHNIVSHDCSHNTLKLPQQCSVVTTAIAPITSSTGDKRKRENPDSSQAIKKSCVVNLRSIKATSTDDQNKKLIRTDKVSLSVLKSQPVTDKDVSLKKIIQQKSMSLNLVKLSSDQLPVRKLWPSPKSQSTPITLPMPKGRSNGFTFNLDKVVSRAAEEFSFTALSAKPSDTVNKNDSSVFQRLGEKPSPFKEPMTPKTPPNAPQEDDDFLELHTVDNFLEEMDDNVLTKPIAKKQMLTTQPQVITTNTITTPVVTSSLSAQKCVQFEDKMPFQPSKHHQICQWVNKTRTNPPPPPPGYHTSSDESSPALFSFPSSPVPIPVTSPPNLEDDFDSLSVQLNVPKEVNRTMEDARKLISDSTGASWKRRESLNTNGIVWGGAPKGMCFKYWNSGSCLHINSCKFHHVRNPAVDKWWNSEGFLREMELLISHSVETAWLHLKARPLPLTPPSLLQSVIVACTNRPPTYIQIAEGAFSRLYSQPRCSRDCFFAMLKCYATHHCNKEAFGLIQEMSKYGYLLSKDMALCLIGCYQPPVTGLLDLTAWIENAGFFTNMFNRIAHCVTMETPLEELFTFLKVCAKHRVKLHHGSTANLVKICVAHNNCEAVIRVLEVSHDPSIITAEHLEYVMKTYTPEQLDRVTNIVVTLFPFDLCQKVSSKAWNKLLFQCCLQQRSAKAMQIFHYMSNASVKIDKEVYVSLMTLHCEQRHPSEVLTVLEHQIRCHGDTSSVLMICQELVNHQYWGVVCDLIVCLIKTGNKPDEAMVQDVKNVLIQNKEEQHWKSLLEKAESMGVDLDHPVIPALTESPKPAAVSSPHFHHNTLPLPEQHEQQQEQLKQDQSIKKTVSFCLDFIDSSQTSPGDVAPPPIAVPSPTVAPPPIAASSSTAAPPLFVALAPSQQQSTITPTSLQALRESSPEFSFALPDDKMMQEHNVAPPTCMQPQSSVPSLEDGGVFSMVKKSIVDGQWLSLRAIVHLVPISAKLVQVMAAAIQSHSDVPNAMASLVTSFKKFHEMENDGESSSDDLTSDEQNLISQVGVSMIMNAIAMEKWQAGFDVLYALHHHGIHYVNDQGGWSPCLIAMAAVECCLCLNNPNPRSALEVMKGAQWVTSSNPLEKNRRNTVLEKLLRSCVTKSEIVGAEETLRAMKSTVSTKKHGELNQLVLMAAKQNGRMDVYNRLCKKNQLPSVANTTVTSFTVEAGNNSTVNLFSADKRTQFESQVATSSTNTAIPGLTTSLAKKDAPPEAKRKMKTEFRNDVLKACSQPLKRFFKEKRISKEDYFHLSNVLSKKFYRQVEAASPGPWELTDSLNQEIHQAVENLFLQCTVYTKDLDSKLNLESYST